MLTIHNHKKLDGLVLKDGLKVLGIADIGDAYSIWLSDGTNIEIDREPHWKSSTVAYYKMYIVGGISAMTEFIMIQTINTLDRMAKHLIYIHDKYINK